MIDKNSELKVYGPYDYEKKQVDFPYITLFLEKKKVKLPNSNTEINLEDIFPHFFASKKFTYQELKIIDESRLVWTDNTRSRLQRRNMKQWNSLSIMVRNCSRIRRYVNFRCEN